MRDIKFRAWLPNEETMLFSENNVDDDFMEIWDFEGVEIQIEKFKEGGGEIHTTLEYERPKDQIMMQYTGLKDKNGKEIYEGDILSVPYVTPFGELTDEEDLRAMVVFEYGEFGLKYPNHTTSLKSTLNSTKGKYIPNYGNPTIYENNSFCKIIGNIHEDANLLQ